MGKVLASISNGFPGTVSRSIDNVIISMKNNSGGEIPFGAPVFLQSGQGACQVFDPDTSTEVYGSDEGAFGPADPVEILVRGSMTLHFAAAVSPGSKVYIRKSDGALVGTAGASGTTLQVPNMTVRMASDSSHNAEVVITKRNIM